MQSDKTAFYKALESLQPRRQGVEKARLELQSVMKEFDENLKTKEVVLKNRELNERVRAFRHGVEGQVKRWMESFRQKEQDEKFQSDLQNSFIVIIYGKVKAGKSTLGNFVAANKLKEQEILFTIYDDKGEAKHSNELVEFKTDILECTAQIQLFRLASLAWVDTPGLSSMTGANGELARSYINNADFVIFPTSSDSPLQQDEIGQIKELVSLLNKPFSLFITKSDKVEKDEKDGKLIDVLTNKTKENRELQEADVKKRLAEFVNVDSHMLSEVISFSVFTAKEGLKNGDSKLYAESNIEQFYKILNESVLKKADRLKSEAPLKGLAGLINGVLDGEELKKIDSDFDKLNSELVASRKKLADIRLNLTHKARSIISDVVIANEERLDETNSKERFRAMNGTIKENIDIEVKKELEKFSNEFDTNLFSAFSDSGEFVVSARHETIHYTDYSTASTLGGAGAGATAGFLLGGPIGAFIGGIVGGVAGNKLGSSEKTERFRVGDNKQEVLREFQQKKNKDSEQYILDVENYIKANLIDKFSEILEFYKTKTEEFKSNLQKLRGKFAKDSTC